MESYHHAWLRAHPERSERWLREKLAEGFDVHHLDGDHSNDDPDNLVLMECSDHMRLHGGRILRAALRDGQRERTEDRRARAGRIAYGLLANGIDLREVERVTGYRAAQAKDLAREHAKAQGKYWPEGRYDAGPIPWPGAPPLSTIDGSATTPSLA